MPPNFGSSYNFLKKESTFLVSVEVTPSVFYAYMEEKYYDEYYCFGYELGSSG
jgi:hypothetical protein